MANETENIREELKELFPEHNPKKSYKELSVVYTEIDGDIDFYQAIKQVPCNISIRNTNFWKHTNID